MFRGKIFLTNIRAEGLPWSNLNRMETDSELRPYLVISLDAEEKKRLRCEDNSEDQIATDSPNWSELFVQLAEVEENNNLQFTIYHNSKFKPHLPIAHMDFDIDNLKETLDRGTTNELRFNENFSAGGSISFNISMKEDDNLEVQSKYVLKRGDKVTRCFPIRGHKFMKNYFTELTFCQPCGKLIWGVTGVQQNGLKCANCKMACHRRCYPNVLSNCTQAKTPNPISAPISGVKLNNKHVWGKEMVRFGKICRVHMQYIWNGKCVKCRNCDAYVHYECRDLLGNDCGVNTSVLIKRLEKTNQERAKREAEAEANRQLEEAFKNIKGRTEGQLSLKDFDLLKVLGFGAFGKVMLVVHKGKPYALKSLKKDNIIEEDEIYITMTERKVLSLGTECRFITKLFCSFQTSERLFFVMEYLNGGDLFFHILTEGRFSEERSRFYCAEIVLAFIFLHDRGILYRDLKPDNVMMTSEGHVKLTDFGMCKENITATNLARTFCGTPHYIAPEILKEEPYGFQTDFWSLGILTYEMIFGQVPFNSKRGIEEIYRKIKEDDLRFRGDVSPEAQDFLNKQLAKMPQERLVGEDVKSHPFFGSLDWEALAEGKVEPPFLPNCEDPFETKYFEDQFTNMETKFSKIEMDRKLKELCETSFPDFSFYIGNAND